MTVVVVDAVDGLLPAKADATARPAASAAAARTIMSLLFSMVLLRFERSVLRFTRRERPGGKNLHRAGGIPHKRRQERLET